MNTISLHEITMRVANWNKARYEQVYDHKLSCALLAEELDEFFEAETMVDQLDAMCDTIYVALGIIWKLDSELETLTYNAIQVDLDCEQLLLIGVAQPAALAVAVQRQMLHDGQLSIEYYVQMIISLCMIQMSGMGLSSEEQLQALNIVCDSNDTKSVKKTEAHIKANDGDKGQFFQSPEPKLAKVCEAVVSRNVH